MKVLTSELIFTRKALTIILIGLLLPSGCVRNEDAIPASSPEATHDAEASPSSRVDVPQTVRRNLGITFVKVEARPIKSTIRLPGQFELRPEARREYHVMLPGRIELLVDQYDHVEADQPLFHLDSPEWQKMKSDLVSARNAMRKSHADVAVAEAVVLEAEQAVSFQQRRLANLAEAQIRQVTLEAELENKRNSIPRLRAELEAARTEFDAAHSRYDVMLTTASSLTGVPQSDLDPRTDDHGHVKSGEAPWRSISRLTVRAEAAGIVDRLAVTNKGWANTGDLVLHTIDPKALRFHGDALQTDIALFSNGQSALISPPPGGSIDLQDTADGTITVGVQAHSQQRTVPILVIPEALPSWAKAGVTAYLEVFTNGREQDVLAIPEAAIVRDGLDKVFFRRDPSNANKVIRMVADLGATDGRWTEICSGVMRGDEVVLGGVYPLMLASSASGELQKGGHFHTDGTFHAEDE